MSDYQIADRKDSRALTEFLQKEGQFLLPIVSLIETAQGAIDEVIDVAGRATIEAVLHLSAQEVAGEKHPGQAQGAIRWHGQQSGVVPLSNRKLRVRKPRLRHKEQGEVEVSRPTGHCRPTALWRRGCWTFSCTASRPDTTGKCCLRWLRPSASA